MEGNEDLTIEELVQQLEDANKQKEKIANDYKTVEAERNSYRDSLTKTRGAIEANKLGKFDDSWNLHIEAKQTVSDQPKDDIQVIEEQIKELKSKYDSGDIDNSEYVEMVSELKAEKATQKALAKLRAEEEIRTKNYAVKSDAESVLSELDSKLPGHNDRNSDLFKEMSAIVAENPAMFKDIDLSDINNIRMRSMLAQNAQARLIAAGKVVVSDKNRRDAAFNTINSGVFNDSVQSGLTDAQKNMVVNLGFNQKIIKDLDSKFSKINENGGKIYLES